MTVLRTAEPFGHFRVTYDVITEESAQQGDTAENGWLDWRGYPVDAYDQSCWDLRDLLENLQGYRAEGTGEAVPRWICIDSESDFFLSAFWRRFAGDDAIGASVHVHRPDWITNASWLRVCRILGWRG